MEAITVYLENEEQLQAVKSILKILKAIVKIQYFFPE